MYMCNYNYIMYIYIVMYIYIIIEQDNFIASAFFTVNHSKYGCMVSHSIIRTAHIEKNHKEKKNEGY